MKWTAMHQEDGLEHGVWKHLHRVRVGHILDQVEGVKGRLGRRVRILDVGCGDGVITRRLRERFPDEALEALDADPVRLERAQRACPGAVFRDGDATALPYDAETFDVVLCHHLVEHVADDAAVLRECHRVLTPDGVLLLGIPHEDGAVGRTLRRLHRKMYAEGEHVNFYTIDQMRRRLAEHGFADIRCAKFGLLVPEYHLHVLWTWLPLTFRLGHFISQRCDATADSLIFAARKVSLAEALV